MTVAVFVLLLFAISILIFFSAVFSGLETALFALKRHQLRRLEEHHPALTKFIHAFRENPRRTLNMLLLGDVLVNVPLVLLCLVLALGRAVRQPNPRMADCPRHFCGHCAGLRSHTKIARTVRALPAFDDRCFQFANFDAIARSRRPGP